MNWSFRCSIPNAVSPPSRSRPPRRPHVSSHPHRPSVPAPERGTVSIVVAAVLAAALASGGTAALVAGPLGLGPTVAPTTAPAGVTVVSGSTATASAPVLTDVVAAVRDSVVTITSEGISSRGLRSIPSSGVGSGVVLTADGFILTNKHVVSGSQSLTVEFADGRQFPATIVTESSDKDLALIKVEATGTASRDDRRFRDPAGRPDGHRHRQSAGHVHRDRDQRHPVGDGSYDHRPR